MFTNQRYITRGIEAEVPLWLQNLIWYAVDTMQVDSKDYLQVFTLTPAEGGKQKLVHKQEEPPYEKAYTFDTDAPVTAKVFVIDDETHTTMLMADEY